MRENSLPSLRIDTYRFVIHDGMVGYVPSLSPLAARLPVIYASRGTNSRPGAG